MVSLASCGHWLLCWSWLPNHVNTECSLRLVLCGPLRSGCSSHVVPGLASQPAAFGCGLSLLCSQHHEIPACHSPRHLGMSGHAFHSPGGPREVLGAKLRPSPPDPSRSWFPFDAGTCREWIKKPFLSSSLHSNMPSLPQSLASDGQSGASPSHSPLGAKRGATFRFCILSDKNLLYITSSSGVMLALCLQERWFMRKRNRVKGKKELDKQKKLAN